MPKGAHINGGLTSAINQLARPLVTEGPHFCGRTHTERAGGICRKAPILTVG